MQLPTIPTPRLILCLLIGLAGTIADADSWSGKLIYKLKTPEYETELRVFTNGSAWRWEMGDPANPHTVWLYLPELDETVQLSTFKKTYTRLRDIPPGDPRGSGGKEPADIKVESLGEKDILGYPCQGFKLSAEGPDTEVWLSRDSEGLPRPFLKILTNMREIPPGIVKLAEFGQGMLFKVTRKSWMGRATLRLELMEMTEGPVSGDIFVLPEDYRHVGSDVPLDRSRRW